MARQDVVFAIESDPVVGCRALIQSWKDSIAGVNTTGCLVPLADVIHDGRQRLLVDGYSSMRRRSPPDPLVAVLQQKKVFVYDIDADIWPFDEFPHGMALLLHFKAE